jgi:hypothetical protein
MIPLLRAFGIGFAGLALAAAAAISPASAFVVSANGTCIHGNCATPDSLGFPGFISNSPFSGTFTVNGDPYSIIGKVFATNSHDLTFNTTLNPSLKVTYTGLAPLAQADAFVVTLQQNYVSFATKPGVYQYDVRGTSSKLPPSSSLTVDNLINGVSVSGGVVPLTLPGPFDSGPQINTISTLANPLTDVFSYAFSFGSNTLPGAFVEVAEPGSLILVGTALVALGAARRRRRQR